MDLVTKGVIEYKVFTTPESLRTIADKMEEFWGSNPVIGTSTAIHSWFGKGVVVTVCADQTAMANDFIHKDRSKRR